MKSIYKLLLTIAVGSAVFIGGFFYYDNRDLVESNLNDSLRVTELKDKKVLVENTKESVEITLNPGWMPAIGTDDRLILRADKMQSEEIIVEDPVGVSLLVYSFAKAESLTLDRWILENNIMGTERVADINGSTSFRKSSKLLTEAENSFEKIQVEDSSIVTYFIDDNSRIIEVQCVSRGNDYRSLALDCESIVNTFRVTYEQI
jgi:hypothetical protein